MAQSDKGTAVADLEEVLTEVIRLARDPRLTELMSSAIDPVIDRRLLIVLNLIADRGPLRAADLVDVMAVDQSTVSRQVSMLAEHGLVTRAPDPDDRRALLVSITAEGRRAIEVARDEWRRTLAEITKAWSAVQVNEFVALLGDLASGLGHVVVGDVSPRWSPNR